MGRPVCLSVCMRVGVGVYVCVRMCVGIYMSRGELGCFTKSITMGLKV